MRISVRAVAWNDDGLILIRRNRPGREEYYVFPGGGVESEDASLEHALERELREELGALVQEVCELAVIDHADTGTSHFFECRIPSHNKEFIGAEATDLERGTYELVTVQSREALEKLDVFPVEMKEILLKRPQFAFAGFEQL